MSNDNHVFKTIPYTGKCITDVPLFELHKFAVMRREKYRRQGRAPMSHVKADLDAIEKLVASRMSASDVECEVKK